MKLPRNSKFATEVYISQCNVDWGSEEIFASHLDSSGIFLDVGANIGYYSLYMLPRVGGVQAFEPDPNAQAVLRENLYGRPNTEVHGFAVGRRSGRGPFISEKNSEVSHLADPLTENGKKSLEIDVITIDDFVADRKLAITGMKIDVEGADVDVIEGALTTLESQFPLVLTETTPGNRLLHLVEPLGYRVFGFIKSPKTVQFRFREIGGGDNLQTKMLFLVPPPLQYAFERLVDQIPRSNEMQTARE